MSDRGIGSRFSIHWLRFSIAIAICLAFTPPSFAAIAADEDLLAYARTHVDSLSRPEIEATVVRYNRVKHFGTWVDNDTPSDCQETRSEVLIRDNQPREELHYREPGQCFVIQGLWSDPYTGTDFKLATEVQIDHVVPLKNAYLSGAYAWRPAQRCHYANFTENDFHLKAVSARENMVKSDRGPEYYMPPNQAYACQYLNVWLKIKAIWSLNLSALELSTIEQLLRDKNCPASTTLISATELATQRALANDPTDRCEAFEDRLQNPPPPRQAPRQGPSSAAAKPISEFEVRFGF